MPFTGVLQEPEPPPLPQAKFQLPALTLTRGNRRLDLPFRHTSGNWCLAAGIEGLDQPDSSVFEERAAGQHGSYIRGIDVPAREVFLPIVVHVPHYQDMLELRDEYNSLTSPYGNHATRITFTRPDGRQRWIEGYRVGTGPRWSRTNWSPRVAWQKFGQVFRCEDPWWHGSTQQVTWRGPEEVDFFPITPVFLQSSQVIGEEETVNVRGDVTTYPIFELFGPMTSVTVTHVESERSWTLNAELPGLDTGNPDAHRAVVNTDPRAAQTALPVQGPDGSSWFKFLEPPYDLWDLPPGEQTILVDVVDADASTRVRMTVVALWETA